MEGREREGRGGERKKGKKLEECDAGYSLLYKRSHCYN